MEGLLPVAPDVTHQSDCVVAAQQSRGAVTLSHERVAEKNVDLIKQTVIIRKIKQMKKTNFTSSIKRTFLVEDAGTRFAAELELRPM